MEVITVDNYRNKAKKSKRRKRVSRACASCKKRKIKCDAQRPRCTQCISKGYDSCEYETILENQELYNLKQENAYLRELLCKQVKTENATSNERNSPRVDLFTIHESRKRISFFGLTAWRPAIHPKSYLGKFFKQHVPFVAKERRGWKKEYKEDKNVRCNDIKSTEEILPDFATVSYLVTEFFNSIWFECFPIVDKEEILENFQRIFAQNNTYIEINIESERDYSMLSLILVIMKYSLLSDPILSEKCLKILSANDLFLYLIDGLHGRGDFIKRATLPTLQALLLHRYFKIYNHFDGDGCDGFNGTSMFALCFEVSISFGLHKNIDEVYYGKSEKHRKILKSIWRCVVNFDAFSSIEVGHPLHLNETTSDLDWLRNSSEGRFALLFRECSKLLLSFETTEDNVLRCLEILKDYLTKNHNFAIKEKINEFSLSSSNNYYNIMNFCEAVHIASLIQHLNFLLYTQYSEKNFKILQQVYQNNCMNYSYLLIVSIRALMDKLNDLYREGDTKIYSILLYATGNLIPKFLKSSVYPIVIIYSELSKEFPDYSKAIEIDFNKGQTFVDADNFIVSNMNLALNNAYVAVSILESFIDTVFLKDSNNRMKGYHNYVYSRFAFMIFKQLKDETGLNKCQTTVKLNSSFQDTSFEEYKYFDEILDAPLDLFADMYEDIFTDFVSGDLAPF